VFARCLRLALSSRGRCLAMMKKYLGFKYKIRIRPDGRYLFAVWWADANSRREDPIWLKTAASEQAAERIVKRWIDDRQPKPCRKRPHELLNAAHRGTPYGSRADRGHPAFGTQ
jgi:hypothetical protein